MSLARHLVIGLVLLALIGVGLGPGLGPRLALGASVRVAPQAPAQILVLNPKQDTFVEEAAPSAVHPTDSLVYVGRVSGQKGDMDIQALLQFDLSDLPAGAKITNATLEIYQIETAGEKSFNIWPDVALKPWDETTANWDNRPSMQSVDPEVGVDLNEGWKQFSVFNGVSDWVDGLYSNQGFVLRGDSRTLGLHGFYASATNNPPTLTIEYTVADTCQVLQSSTQIPSPALINFDDLNNATIIADSYRASHGVRFENGDTTQAIIYANEPTEAHSPPNMAINSATSVSNNIPMRIDFDGPKTHVGMYLGNGETLSPTAVMIAYDGSGNIICQGIYNQVPELHTAFLGIHDPAGRIRRVTVDYGDTILSESIDDLFYAPGATLPTATNTLVPNTATNTPLPPTGTATNTPRPPTATNTSLPPTPTRTPQPTWTPVPTQIPTAGPTPTPTPLLAVFPYQPPQNIINPQIFQGDVSIHGIEITQGIQCFDTSKGLAGCVNNSLPVVVKKDTTARIYLRYGGPLASMGNVPVRLHISANGVEYTANASGRAWPTVDQGRTDSANVYFNVNFTNNMNVQFWAEVDPNNTISESNETNNRFPASGTFSLNFQRRDTMKIVGQRTRYHPSGYSGGEYAGGWAVDGGAADWFEQLLPIRNNGIDYGVASGYMDVTTSLNSGAGQHDLIQRLNNTWVLQNALSFFFGSTFLGADHVYGWVDNDGYSGGHADMPVYPHAGGLGIVGIGTDRPGTSTDNPGGGALIFGHELIHDYNVLHTDTADSCGSSDDNSTFPYGSSSIQEFGFNPITGRIYNPADTHDVMSYCPAGGSKNGWVSPFTWSTMFNRLAPSISAYSAEVKVVAGVQEPEAPQMVGVMRATGAAESLVINATIFNPDHADYDPTRPGKLGDLHRIGSGMAYALPTGDYAVELRDGEEVLASHAFTLTFESEYDGHSDAHSSAHGDGPTHVEADEPPFPSEDTASAGVALIVPWEEGTTSVVLLHGETVLDQRAVSDNAPTVAFTSPAITTTWPSGSTQNVTWTGADLDGDPLNFSVFYSGNGGTDWTLISTGLSTPSLGVEVDALAGTTDARFRVVATDGINTAWAETPWPITIPNKAPQALIMDPVDGMLVAPGSLVVLLGAATDLEDGRLPDEVMQWTDDRQGSLGVGPSVALNTLEPGPHLITLTVRDQFGITGTATVNLYVGYRIFLPGLQK